MKIAYIIKYIHGTFGELAQERVIAATRMGAVNELLKCQCPRKIVSIEKE